MFGSFLFLPAAGYRSYSNGLLSNRGYYGYYWSSTYHSTSTAHALHFRSSTINACSGDKTYGFSVRCIAE